MRTLIDLCTCTDRPKAFGRSLHQLMVVMGVAVAFAISGNALACLPGSCVGSCGGSSPDGCWCDDFCVPNNDCCTDKQDVCGGDTSCVGNGGECVCTTPGGIGCPGFPQCEAAVCACDPFCCDVSWDISCASTGFEPDCLCGPGTCGALNTAECCEEVEPDCGVGGTGNCCEDNGTPYCDDAACCEQICAADPFCCDVEWDDICADDANANCAVCQAPVTCGPGAGPCCSANGTPGCEDEACCDAVCACDPFCCDVEWDGFCSTFGFEPDCLCGPGTCGALNTAECDCEVPEPCPPGATGDCCVAHDQGTGCEDPDCCNMICNQDAFCCDVSWDGLCAGAAQTQCEVCLEDPACGVSGTGDCCSANNTPFCDDGECCEQVCAIDSFCCDVEWDSICAGIANADCAVCQAPVTCGPGAGDCCSANGTPGCEDEACCDAVCACDPFCCDVSWDISCASTGFEPDCLCGPGTCGALNTAECNCEIPQLCPESDLSCCEAHPAGNPGCNDPDCCELICTADPFCCNTNWDGLCANAANNQCEVCEVDPEGCSLGFWKNHTENWSGYSPDDIFDEVFGSDVAATSNCCSSQCIPTCAGAGNPTGCDDPDCTAAVCAADSFCCNTGWDGLCASAAANTHCVALCAGGAAPLGVMGDATLLEVISSPSGGPNSVCPSRQDCNLGKQAVAALLNAAAGIAYPLTEDEVKDAVASAFDSSDRNAKEALKDELDAFNNLGCPEFAAADLNQDEMVNVFDLLEVLGDWGQTAVPADINRDGIVNVFDLLKVLANWGPAPVEWVPTNELR